MKAWSGIREWNMCGGSLPKAMGGKGRVVSNMEVRGREKKKC